MRGLASHILIPVVLALATNGLIFALGWRQPDHDRQPAFAPPGFVIGIVWTFLFALIGLARGLAVRHGTRPVVRLVTILIALCLAYPFYTLGFQDRLPDVAGIVVTGVFTAYVIARARRPVPAVSLTLLPLLAWLCFAGVLVISVARLNP